MASTLCQKWLNIFLRKSSKFCIVRTIRFCSNFTSMWSKYLANINVERLLDLYNDSISNGNVKYLRGKSIFAVHLPLKLIPATVANADIGSQKSLHTLFDKYLGPMLVKFEQNCMVQTTRNLGGFDKKSVFLKLFLTTRWRHLEDVSVTETVV